MLSFPYRHPVNPTCPYQQVHDEVLNLMPLSDTPSASDPTLIDSAGQHEYFCINNVMTLPFHGMFLFCGQKTNIFQNI